MTTQNPYITSLQILKNVCDTKSKQITQDALDAIYNGDVPKANMCEILSETLDALWTQMVNQHREDGYITDEESKHLLTTYNHDLTIGLNHNGKEIYINFDFPSELDEYNIDTVIRTLDSMAYSIEMNKSKNKDELLDNLNKYRKKMNLYNKGW